MVKKFEVTLTVFGCSNCPFCNTDANENYYCSQAEVADLFSARQLIKQNRDKLTETCPYFEQAEEAENISVDKSWL